MTNKKKFYVTTPIYYPNDIPHLGHAYTTIAADVLARWNKVLGKEVFFLTGTDEHGKKLEEAAKKAGKKPKEFIDSIIPEFKNAWKSLNIEYDKFIRTTDTEHEKVVKEILSKVYENGDIYLGNYEGFYCTGCEAYYTEKDAPNNICPIHQKPLELLKEESYFFRLSKYQKKLLELYKKNPELICPESKRNEIVARIKEGLRDFSISRTSFDWGIPLPFNKKHVCYVWFDALLNYYSATRDKGKEKFWPADVHIIGKDILWFHAAYWPAMLMSAGIDLPKKVFAHGWWTVLNQKMGKSAGNAIKVQQLINYAGTDSARYFLLRNTVFGEDGDFSESALIDRHNNELANKLGNLVSRVSTLAESYGLEKCNNELAEKNLFKNVSPKKTDEIRDSRLKLIESYIDNLEFDKALNEIFTFIDFCNEYVQKTQPWKTKDKRVLYELADSIKNISILLSPFIPETCEKIAETFNFDISIKSLETPLKISKIKKSPVLFKKIDFVPDSKKTTEEKVNKSSKIAGIMSQDNIKYEDFSKLDLRVAKILNVEDIEGKDKLYKLQISLGKEEKTIVAGIKPYYSKEKLHNKKIIVISNLEPAKIGGVESNGMLLAASTSDKSKVILLTPDSDIEEGSRIG